MDDVRVFDRALSSTEIDTIYNSGSGRAGSLKTLTIVGDTTFAANDILRIKDGTDDEWFIVLDATSAPVYDIARDRAADYGGTTLPEWKKGTSVVNFGASGEGGIFMTSSETNAPYMSVVTHAGSPWSTLTTRMRLGNLNGFLGYLVSAITLGFFRSRLLDDAVLFGL